MPRDKGRSRPRRHGDFEPREICIAAAAREDRPAFWRQRVADGAVLVDRRREVVPWLAGEEEKAS